MRRPSISLAQVNAELQALFPPKRVSKYKAVPTEVDGVRFASKKEARRYGELKLLEKAGQITSLRLQPKYPLHAWLGGLEFSKCAEVGTYIGDFEYRILSTGKYVTEDVKGVRTAVYRLKKKIIEANYGIVITEI